MRRYVPTTMLRYISIALVIAGLSIPFTAAAGAPMTPGFTQYGPADTIQPGTTLASRSLTSTKLAAYNTPGFVP